MVLVCRCEEVVFSVGSDRQRSRDVIFPVLAQETQKSGGLLWHRGLFSLTGASGSRRQVEEKAGNW